MKEYQLNIGTYLRGENFVVFVVMINVSKPKPNKRSSQITPKTRVLNLELFVLENVVHVIQGPENTQYELSRLLKIYMHS